jgi:hypothetical protein
MRKEEFEAYAAKLEQMIHQEALSTEIQEWLDGETKSWVNIETLDHDQDVLWVIRWAFDKALFMHGDKPDTIQNWVASALAIVTNVRQTDAKHSKSVLLRDAQRYLWGRAGVPIHAADSLLPAGVYETFAEPGAFAYDTGKWMAQGYDGAFGTHTARSTGYPASPSGGTFWFSLGLRHYVVWDKNHLADKDLLVPEITNVWEMRFFQYSSGFVPAGGGYTPP